jgi:simple sugar transport system ATP-binding protein
MAGISKRFGEVQALYSVELQVKQGTIHAVVGVNGAGKTTLMGVLYGSIQPDEGALELDGTPVRFSNSKHAIEAGIGMVSQHYGIIPELTCLQNLMLGAEGGGIIHPRAAVKRADELAQKMGFRFDWHRDAEGLGPTGAQKLEILKLLWRNARIMILDEPTAMLSPADGDALFASLKQLARSGSTVILVTHRLPEVLEHCDTVTVLREGKRVAEMDVSATNGGELARLIVGGEVAVMNEATRTLGEEVLSLNAVSARGHRGDEALKDVSLRVRSGEIVGIAGVDGSGQRELFRIIAGLLRPSSGEVLLPGQTLAERIASGLRIIPEDRHLEGVIEDWSLEENAALGMQRLPPFARGTSVDARGRRRAAEVIANRFRTRHGGLSMPIRSLSGGNQQRFVAARALFLQPKLVLAFQPARGLDLNSTTHVYEGIREACSKGAGAIVVSPDLDELLNYCDRLVVINGGRLLEPPARERLDRDAIGRLMVGAA